MAVVTGGCGIFGTDHFDEFNINSKELCNRLRGFQYIQYVCVCGTFRCVFRTRDKGTLWELQENMAVPALLYSKKKNLGQRR